MEEGGTPAAAAVYGRLGQSTRKPWARAEGAGIRGDRRRHGSQRILGRLRVRATRGSSLVRVPALPPGGWGKGAFELGHHGGSRGHRVFFLEGESKRSRLGSRCSTSWCRPATRVSSLSQTVCLDDEQRMACWAVQNPHPYRNAPPHIPASRTNQVTRAPYMDAILIFFLQNTLRSQTPCGPAATRGPAGRWR